MLKKLNTSLLSVIYICFMIVYMTVREILPLNFLIDSTAVSAVIFAGGFALILLDLLKNKKCLEGIIQDILILFLGICCISSVINMKYGMLFSNLKFIAALGIELLLVFTVSRNLSVRKLQKILNPVTLTLIIAWFIPVFFSVLTYFYDVDIIVSGRGTWGEVNQGFSLEYFRLWGIFQDPNYASVTSIISIFASLRFILNDKKALNRILLGVNILFQTMYIILGGSRAALLLLLGSVVIFFGHSFILSGSKEIKKTLTSLGRCAVCIIISVVIVFGSKYALPYVKAIFFSKNEAVAVMVNSAYEKLYDLSGYEYTSLSPYSEPDDTPDDTTTSEDESSEAESTENESTENTTDEPSTEKDPSGNKPIVITPIDRTDLTEGKDVSNGRFTRWKQTFTIFLQAPFFGTSPRGLTAFARNHESTKDTIISKFAIAPHNGYLDVLVETGIAGFSILGAALLLALYVIFRNLFRKGNSTDKGFLLIGILSLFGIAVFISDVFMLFSVNSLLFWLFMGIAYNYSCTHEDKGIIFTVYNKTAGRLISKITSKKDS